MSSPKLSANVPAHLACLKKHKKPLTLTEGQKVDLWTLTVPAEEGLLSKWATSVREHYCLDSEIDRLRGGTGLSRKDYLLDLIFPDKSKKPGPSIRAGDFAEILIADYLEFLIGYWVPRDKYKEKAIRDESIKGVDVLGFLMPNPKAPSPDDTLITFEVKAQLTKGKYEGRLQDAIDGSSKDILRRAYTLNATKRRLLKSGDNEQALIVERFQNKSDRSYVYRSGAAAVLSDSAFDEDEIVKSTKVSEHDNKGSLDLLVMSGTDLMSLVHALYERAANEA